MISFLRNLASLMIIFLSLEAVRCWMHFPICITAVIVYIPVIYYIYIYMYMFFVRTTHLGVLANHK